MTVRNKDRRWFLSAMDSPQELAECLVRWKWPLCSGFELSGRLIALNDTDESNSTTSSSNVHDFAIVCPAGPGRFRFLGAIRVGSTRRGDGSCRRALQAIRQYLAERPSELMMELNVEPLEDHRRCQLCA